MYDVTRQQSFDSVLSWCNEVKEHNDPDIVMMLVGNKLDKVQSNPSARQISTEKAGKFAEKHGMLFMETSAVENINVQDCFEYLVQEIYNAKS